MPSDVIIFLPVYAMTSFVLTALFVRLAKTTALAVKIRRHFYCFPVIPAWLIIWSLTRGMIWTWWALMDFLRYCFETLSGEKLTGDKDSAVIMMTS